VNPWYYRHVDPSEGVRADEIIPVMRRFFSDLEIHDYHGSLLHHVLDDRFFAQYDDSSTRDRALLAALVDFERGLIEAGEIGSDHAVLVARKPS
jgi:hypothetical protein